MASSPYLPFPTPPPRRKRSNKSRATVTRTAPSTPIMATRNDPEGASSSPDRRCLSLDVRPRERATSDERPKSAEPRRGSAATNEFLLQKPKGPRRNSIAGSIVSMLSDIKPISLSDMKREVEKRTKRSRTRSNSFTGCEEVPQEEEAGGLSAAAGCDNIPKAVEMAPEKTISETITPIEPPAQSNNPLINVTDTSKEETITAKDIASPMKLEEPDGACCTKFEMEQPTHVQLPELKEKYVTKLVVSFDDMDGPTKTSVYVSPTVSTTVSSANIDTNSVTNETLDIFECGICTESLSIPKSLPCLHNFCLQCLEKYFSANHIEDGQEFRCPTCRSKATVPEDGGAIRFPTNFHIENLRKQAKRKNTDVEAIVNDALAFLEQREIDIIETLTERKRKTLADMGCTRERFVTALDNYLEELQVTLEEKYHEDSTHIVTVIHRMRDKLEQLQSYLEMDESESDAVVKLRQQGEIITNVASELEEIKSKVNSEVDKILRHHLKFELGDSDSFRFSTQLGKLVSTQVDEDGKEIGKSSVKELTVVQWFHSWGMLFLGLLPALVFCYLVKVIANIGKKHG